MKTYIRKSLSVLLSVLMALSVFGGLTFTAGAANTYQISSYAELSAFADAVNGGETDACAILTADFTAEGTDWTPIGDLNHPYVGTFDGDGHTITGLSTESSAGRDYVGLFGYVGADGVVQNVGLVGGCIKGQDLVGAVAGENIGKIINCYNMGTVQSIDDRSFVGGVVGRNIEGTVRSCYNTGTVNGLKAYAGGVVGIISEGTVQNCYNTGDVSGAIVGGVAGFNNADNGGSAEISNCFNTGKISGTNMVGGVAGRNNADDFFGRVGTASVSNCYNMGAISVNGDYGSAGGVIGFNTSDPGSTASVISCYSAGTVTASGFDIDAGGVIGSNHYGAVQNCYYDSDVCAANNGVGTKLTTAQMTGEAALSGMPGFSSENWLVRSADEYYSYYPHLKGFAYDDTATAKDWPARKVKDGAMEISNYDELKAFATAVNGGQTGLKAILKSDIAATDKEWTPIGNKSNPYIGAFDGGGHTITGLSNEEAAATPDSAGLFGYLGENAKVKNVQLTGVDLKATDYLGAVAGDAKGAEITNCRNTGEINCTASQVGGIIGSIRGAIVSNCCNTGDITSTANNAYVGGIAGFLCGDQSAAGITNCYNTGTVTGKGRYSNVGGIAGYANDRDFTVEIANCYNTGAVTATGTSSRAGGIAASSCVFDGGTVEVINCYSAGAVTADERVGGVVGLKYNSAVRNCWYDDNVCNLSSAVGSVADSDDVKGLHMCEMTGADALTQMPFSEPSAWLVKENSDICVFYPHLKGFDLDADGDQMEASAIDAADWPAKRNHSHSYGAPVWSWEKCHGKAAATFTCSGCGDTQTVTDNAPTFENGQFTATVEFEGAPYTDTVSWRTGDLIQFGTYPQSEVTDADLKAALDAADKVWASYDYYTGNSAYDGLMRPGDWMKFADFFCGGEKYRAVTFSQYRPDNTATSLDNPYFSSHQDNNGYLTDTVYYFRYEPLTWRVLDPSAGYIMCESVVDAQAYQNMLYYDAVADVYYQAIGSSVYASDYATSSIRDWLNLDFYETAFTAAQKEAIKTTALNNSGYYTLTGDPDHTQYDSAATNDKIFLLSYMDAQNGAYGLSSADDRIAQGTDYAKCQGLQIFSNGLLSGWWLRSPGSSSDGACEVDVYFGWLSNGTTVNYITEGVRPACCLTTLASDAAVSETLYSCAKAGHTYGDTGDARFTCTVCGHVDDDLKAAAELADAKAAAKEALAKYKNADDYRPAQKTELETAISDGNDNIDTAANIDAVNTALENAKATVDAIKTDAQLTAEELADAKEAAKESLASYKNANDYLDAQRRDLEDAIDAGNVAIDEATDIDAVNAALENAKALIDEIKTAAEMTVATTPVIVRADAKTKVYGDEDPELTYTVEGLKDGDEITVVLSREPGKDVGTYAITAEIDAGDEYEVTYVPANLTITKRALHVIVYPRCKREGKPDPQFHYYVYGKVSGDKIDVKLEREPGEEPGQYTITPKINAGPNYKVYYRTAKLTIEPKECPLCGEIHEGGPFDMIVDMLHRFIYRFKHMFSAFQVNSIIQGDC